MIQHISSDDIIKRFEKDCRIRGLTHETIINYMGQIRIFNKFLKKYKKNFFNVDREILREFIAYLRFERNLSQSRIEHYFSGLSTFYEFLVYEGLMQRNIILEVRKRYLRMYKKDGNDNSQRKLISVEEMANFINSIPDIRDKAIALLLAKTGIRRGELISIDLDDINWKEMSITLKPKPKRSNRIVFFDDETALILRRWIIKRESIAKPDCEALFVSYITGERLNRSGIYNAFVYWAERAGLHNPKSDKMEEHFTPHCCRHWFTTWLRRNGMPREFIQELRGDARKEAMDIYYHIDLEELRKAYLSCIPKLGIA